MSSKVSGKDKAASIASRTAGARGVLQSSSLDFKARRQQSAEAKRKLLEAATEARSRAKAESGAKA